MNVRISVWSRVQWSVETAVDLHCLLLRSSYWILSCGTTLRQVKEIPMEENHCWILLLKQKHVFCLFVLMAFHCRFGRKFVLFLALVLQSVAVLLQTFSPSWTVFCIFFFMNGLGRSSSYNAGFVLGMSMFCKTIVSYLFILVTEHFIYYVFFFGGGGGLAGTEILTGRIRVLFSSMAMCVGFAIGYMILPLLAYLLREWKFLLFAIFLSGLMYIPLWW